MCILLLHAWTFPINVIGNGLNEQFSEREKTNINPMEERAVFLQLLGPWRFYLFSTKWHHHGLFRISVFFLMKCYAKVLYPSPGPNFIELLKHKIAKAKKSLLCKIRLPAKTQLNCMRSKQQLNTSHKQCIWYEILASNMCKISKLFSCLKKIIFLLKQLYEIGPRIQIWVERNPNISF